MLRCSLFYICDVDAFIDIYFTQLNTTYVTQFDNLTSSVALFPSPEGPTKQPIECSLLLGRQKTSEFHFNTASKFLLPDQRSQINE